MTISLELSHNPYRQKSTIRPIAAHFRLCNNQGRLLLCLFNSYASTLGPVHPRYIVAINQLSDLNKQPFSLKTQDSSQERATGIGPASEAWEASILPMNYARKSGYRGQTSANRMRVTIVAGLGDVRESPTPGTVARQLFNPLSDGAVRLDQVGHHRGAGSKQGCILSQGRAVDH